jgi:hypothetical protein
LTSTESGSILFLNITVCGRAKGGIEVLNILKGELIKRGENPTMAIIAAIGCSEKTARDKIRGKTEFTVREAAAIIDRYFPDEPPGIMEMFRNTA